MTEGNCKAYNMKTPQGHDELRRVCIENDESIVILGIPAS